MVVAVGFVVAGCSDAEPDEDAVRGGIYRVITSWETDTLISGSADECDLGAVAVAQRWSQEDFGRSIRHFALVEVTAHAIGTAVSSLFPGSWVVGLVKEEVIGWAVDAIIDLSGPIDLVSATKASPVSSLGATQTLGHLPDDLVFTNEIFATYDEASRMVSLLVVSDCGGAESTIRNAGVRAWEAHYEVGDDGRPVDGDDARLTPINLGTVRRPPASTPEPAETEESPAVSLRYVGVEVSTFPESPGLLLYLFELDGFDLQTLPSESVPAMLSGPPDSAHAYLNRPPRPPQLIIGLAPDYSPGTYEMSFTMPDGTVLQAQFTHPE